MKILQVRAQSFHADGQTDMTKLTVALRNSAHAPYNQTFLLVQQRGTVRGGCEAGIEKLGEVQGQMQ